MNQNLEIVESELKLNQIIGYYWKLMPLHNWEGTQYSLPYDTAWVAALQNDLGNPQFPEALDWLQKNQAIDGSWGSNSNLGERLLATATSIRTFLQYGKKYDDKINSGIKWLNSNLPRLKGGNLMFMAGFEFLLPAILKQIDQYKIDLGTEIKYFQQKQSEKLSKLPMEAILKEKTSKIFTLEFLENHQKALPNIDHLLEENGSLASTPSTTAWYLSKKLSNRNPEMLAYLKNSQNIDGGYPSFADFQLFTIAYVMYPITKVIGKQDYFHDVLLNQYKPFWRKTGVAYSKFFSVTDSDDSFLGLYLMEKYGLISSNNPEWDIINFYDGGGPHYTTYAYEINHSNLSNLHIFDAFSNSRNQKREEILNKLQHFFSSILTGQTSSFGADKFHFSPHCQNCHGILALAQEAPELAMKLFNWFLENQKENGLWSSDPNVPNLEETAYAVLAMCYYHDNVEKIDLERLTPAIRYLTTRSQSIIHPSLWPSKVIYAPIEVINAYILAALIMYKKVRHTT